MTPSQVQLVPSIDQANRTQPDSYLRSFGPDASGSTTSIIDPVRELKDQIDALLAQTTGILNAQHDRDLKTFVNELKAPEIRRQEVRSLGSFRLDRTLPLATWEGVVEKRYSSGFLGRLALVDNGITDTSTFKFSEFDLEEVSESDFELVQPGATFYWSIGRRRNEAGTVTNFSFVRFRRLPRMSVVAQRAAVKSIETALAGA